MQRQRNRLLLNVRVKRVVHHAAAGTSNLAAEAGGVGVRVEQVGFETVERLDTERDVHFAGVFGDGPHAFDAPFPLVFGPPLAAEMAEGRMERADQRGAAGGGAAVEGPYRAFDSLAADGGVGADGVVVGGTDRDGRALQAQIVEDFAPLS